MGIEREIEKLLATGKYADPRLGTWGQKLFRDKQIRKEALPRYGIVSDNKDPMCLGRVRVACMIAPGAVTPWIPIGRPYASKKAGWWYLPDIGTQVLLGFIGNNTAQPFVIGCIYDLKHLPPKHSTEDPSKSIVMQSKNHRLEIIDEEGKETIIISTMKGQMRYEISKEKGIQIINELGDIQIKCRKLKITGGEEVSLQAEKKLTIQSKGTMTAKSKKNTVIQNDKEVKMKGKCIKLEGSKGVTTEGKQLAAEGNQVMGFDVHNMEVPSGKGTTTVPLPHPYIGKLADKLSSDVKIKGHNAATKGSKSKHDDAMHMQLPGTVKFTNNPNKEGEVTGGTGTKVKINGKEAAVIGSTVTTCNDMGARDNSTILAPGASIPMPMIINPKNMESYQLERAEAETKKPEFTTLKWSKTKAKEGEEIELSAQVKDIDDGNMVTFQVFREGQDPNSHVPYGKIPATIEGGAAKAKWQYRLPSTAETIPEQDPAFFFSAHSAWCQWKKSGNAAIELLRPEFSDLTWEAVTYDDEGKETGSEAASEVRYGKTAIAKASVKNVDDGNYVNMRIYEEGRANPYLHEEAVKVEGGAIAFRWDAHVSNRRLQTLTDKDKLRFYFAVDAGHGSYKQESGKLDAVFETMIMIWEIPEEINHNDIYLLESKDSKAYSQECKIQDDLIAEDAHITLLFDKLLPGLTYTLKYIQENDTKGIVIYDNLAFLELIGDTTR